MPQSLRVFTVLAVSFVAILANGEPAQAQHHICPPPQPHIAQAPRLGFSSYFNGCGERVTYVIPRSLAWRIGLEPGDTIVALNGSRLSYDGAWYNLIAMAAYEGHVTLAIRDWRTGRIVYRHIDLGTGPVITAKKRQ